MIENEKIFVYNSTPTIQEEVIALRIENEQLKKENAERSNSVTELSNTKTELENKVTELNEQIEKMKCCGNCKHYIYDCGERYCEYDATREKDCENKNEWELAE